jgi:hypothetical protein
MLGPTTATPNQHNGLNLYSRYLNQPSIIKLITGALDQPSFMKLYNRNKELDQQREAHTTGTWN